MPDAAVVTVAGFTVVSGSVALLTGIAGLRGIHRLRRVGVEVWALQYETRDGRVMEVGSPAPASKRHPLADGSLVLVRYDPDDPRELLLQGRERGRRGRRLHLSGRGPAARLVTPLGSPSRARLVRADASLTRHQGRCQSCVRNGCEALKQGNTVLFNGCCEQRSAP